MTWRRRRSYPWGVDLVDAGAKFLELAAKASQSFGRALSNRELAARLERIPNQLGPYGVDAFGFDPRYLQRFLGLGAWAYSRYFRCQTYGIENIPAGRCILVGNHSGQLPYDGAMIATAVFLRGEPPRVVRAMVERFVPSTPFVSPFLARCGQVLGTPANCRRLLANEEIIQIFPEGTHGLNKTWRSRYQLQRFGQGFMRMAMEMRAPIVPVAVIGAEEQAPTLANLRGLARLLGLPALPLTLAPLGGLIPLPSRYRIYFGTPQLFHGDANDDDDLIVPKVDSVRATLQTMIERGLAAREHIFW